MVILLYTAYNNTTLTGGPESGSFCHYSKICFEKNKQQKQLETALEMKKLNYLKSERSCSVCESSVSTEEAAAPSAVCREK